MCNDCVRRERAERARSLRERPPRDVVVQDITQCALRHNPYLDCNILSWYLGAEVYTKEVAERERAWDNISSHGSIRDAITRTANDCLKVVGKLNELGFKYSEVIGKVVSQKEIDSYLHYEDEK